MKLVMSPQAIAVVRLPVGVPDPEWARGGPLVSVTRTARETSVIVPTSSVPEDVPGPVQGPLVGVYVDEQLDFSQVGILVGLLKPLADAGIPVLTVSTYDTDWVLVEAGKAAAASSVWRAAGYQVVDAAKAADEGDSDADDADGSDDADEADDDADDDADGEADDDADGEADDDADGEADGDADDDAPSPDGEGLVVDLRDEAPAERATGKGAAARGAASGTRGEDST